MKKLYSLFPILSGVCFGSAGIFVRELGENMNSATVIFSRVAFAVVLLTFWIGITHPEYFKIKLKDVWIFIGAGVLGTLGLNICYNFAITELTLSLAAVLLSLAPIFVMIFSFFLFSEQITVKKIICIIMAFLGCIMTSGIFESASGLKWSWIGIMIGSAGAFFYALYSVFSKIAMKYNYHALTITFYSTVAITIVLLPFTQWTNMFEFIAPSPIFNIFFMLIHSLCTAVLPYVFYTIALNHMDTGKASILCSCEPVAAMIFGIIFFREIPTFLSIIGLFLVLASLFILVLPEKIKK